MNRNKLFGTTHTIIAFYALVSAVRIGSDEFSWIAVPLFCVVIFTAIMAYVYFKS